MLLAEKFQVAAHGQPAKTMSVADVNAAIARGELSPDDHYWAKGMSRWGKVRELPGVILPSDQPVASPGNSAPPFTPEQAAFWSQPKEKPCLWVWTYAVYCGLSIPFTPLLGAVLVLHNHRAMSEQSWVVGAWFWLCAWAVFVPGLCWYVLVDQAKSHLLYLGIGYALVSVLWFFTSAFPHHLYIRKRGDELGKKQHWGKPAGIGFLGWMVVATLFLLRK